MIDRGRYHKDGCKSDDRGLWGGWRRNGWKTMYGKKGDLSAFREGVQCHCDTKSLALRSQSAHSSDEGPVMDSERRERRKVDV